MILWSNIAKSIWTKLDMVLFTNKNFTCVAAVFRCPDEL